MNLIMLQPFKLPPPHQSFLWVGYTLILLLVLYYSFVGYCSVACHFFFAFHPWNFTVPSFCDFLSKHRILRPWEGSIVVRPNFFFCTFFLFIWYYISIFSVIYCANSISCLILIYIRMYTSFFIILTRPYLL